MIDKLWEEIREIDKEAPVVKRYFAAGTIQTVPVLNKVGAFPAKYCSLWE